MTVLFLIWKRFVYTSVDLGPASEALSYTK